jgi:hypothetical protein
MSKQDNKKIIEALDMWENYLHGYFWNRDPKKAEFNWLASYVVGSDRPYMDRHSETFCNFSLRNPNEKKLIETPEEARKWAKEKYHTLVIYIRNQIIEYAGETDFQDFLDQYKVQTGIRDDGSPQWSKITEIEVVDE